MLVRFAPTPSGFLHVGNAVNAVLTAWLARSAGGRLLLRIDDFDTGRLRAEYLADIFDTCAWLGIAPDVGPRNPADFLAQWTMGSRRSAFEAARDQLLAGHPEQVFVCRCSRRELGTGGRCRAGCRTAGLEFVPERTVVRLAVEPGETIPMEGRDVNVHIGDHVLWRRDDLPAYQLGSVVADELLGVTHIVRGEDLRDSSALQLHLAGLLPAPGFLRVDLRHHALLVGPDGAKLSKSAGAQAHPLAHTPELRADVQRWAIELGAPIGIGSPD